MANLEVTYSSTVPNPTRQQLDELDTLLQQMLGLPVQPATEEAEANSSAFPEPERTAEPRLTPAALPAATAEEAGTESLERSSLEGRMDFQSVPAESRTDWQSVPLPGRIAKPSYEPAPEGIAALEQMEAQLSQQLQKPENRKESQAGETGHLETDRPTDRHGPWVAFGLRPLIWCNQVFDGLTVPLGPLGRWLRGPSGRWLLGWTGLALLALALALSLFDLIRWIW
jgi:hypothetical protein